MTDRDRLIELFEKIEKDPAITCPHYKTDKTCDTCKYTINNFMCNHTLRTVDYLLANGVIVAPCKVGDTVYVTYAGYVTTAKVLALYIDREGGMFDLQIKTKCENVVGFKMVIDKDNYAFSDVFLTEEEAEEKLKELSENA